MNQHVITAVSRGAATKGELRTKRLSGLIPAVTYGSGKAARSIYIKSDEFMAALATITESTMIDLVVDGVSVKAFVKARQRASVTFDVIHVDFLEIVAGQLLQIKVPIHVVGAAVGIREGGILETPCHEIEVECDPSNLPEKIDIDVSDLHVNHSLHVRDIVLGAGIKVLSSPDQVLVAIKYLRGEQTAEPAAAVVAPAAETPKAAEKK